MPIFGHGSLLRSDWMVREKPRARTWSEDQWEPSKFILTHSRDEIIKVFNNSNLIVENQFQTLKYFFILFYRNCSILVGFFWFISLSNWSPHMCERQRKFNLHIFCVLSANVLVQRQILVLLGGHFMTKLFYQKKESIWHFFNSSILKSKCSKLG